MTRLSQDAGYTDHATLIVVSAVLLVAAFAASLFPAYRAAHVAPAAVLHYE